MNIFFYIIIFIIGIVFGSFYTLAVYRIPKGQDTTHTHSYWPNCNHKLGFWDLIPVFSYIFLGGKCRYCKKQIKPRYLIIELISGSAFLGFAFLIGITPYNIDTILVMEFVFFALYFTFIILMAGISICYKEINKKVLIYGIVISIMYILYLCIIGRTSIYRYDIYGNAIVIGFYAAIINIVYLLLLLAYTKNKKEEKHETKK